MNRFDEIVLFMLEWRKTRDADTAAINQGYKPRELFEILTAHYNRKQRVAMMKIARMYELANQTPEVTA